MSLLSPDALAALARTETLVAVVRGDSVEAPPEAARLGDAKALAELARRALGGPVTVEAAGEPWEARAARDGDAILLVAHPATAARDLADLDAFLHFASHELKGPLHVLGLACHLIEARAAKGEKLEPGSVDQIRRQVTRLTRQINQLLEAGRIRQRRIELLVEEVDLAELANAALEHVDEARRRDVHLRAEPSTVRADRARVTDAIEGLIDNALRFAPPGTPVEIDVRDGSPSTVTVADRGPGVAAEALPQLFALAVGPEARRGRIGLGLGLYLARSVARLHGGDLVYQANDPGARFTLSLPK